MSDVDKIADVILLMKDGQLIYSGKREEIHGDLEEFYMEQFEDERSGEDEAV